MIKTDLNDFAWFVHVVEEGGFGLMNQNQN